MIIYDGPSMLDGERIVAIATWESTNDKTGDMIQLWILPAGLSPLAALKHNRNTSICGNCPLMGKFKRRRTKRRLAGKYRLPGKMINRVCYVNVGQAPMSVWRAWRRGKYPSLNARQDRARFAGCKLRLGAYGDPAALPVPLLRRLVAWSSGHTGYTHQIDNVHPSRRAGLAELVMISCETIDQDARHRAAGRRTFTVVADGAEPPAESVECPYYSRGIQCEQCLLCGGTSRSAKSVWVRAHSRTGLNLPIVQQSL